MKKLLIIPLVLTLGFVFLKVGSAVSLANEVCQQVNISTWTQEQKNMLAAVSMELMADAGSTARLTKWSNQTGQICFDSPTVNLATVLTPQAILDRLALDNAARELERLRQEALIAAAKTELSANELPTLKLSTIDARIDSIDNLVEMKVFMKQLVRYLVAKEIVK